MDLTVSNESRRTWQETRKMCIKEKVAKVVLMPLFMRCTSAAWNCFIAACFIITQLQSTCSTIFGDFLCVICCVQMYITYQWCDLNKYIYPSTVIDFEVLVLHLSLFISCHFYFHISAGNIFPYFYSTKCIWPLQLLIAFQVAFSLYPFVCSSTVYR